MFEPRTGKKPPVKKVAGSVLEAGYDNKFIRLRRIVMFVSSLMILLI